MAAFGLCALLWAPRGVACQAVEDADKGAWDHLKELPVQFASDAWASVSAPFKLRGDDAWAFAGVLGTAGLMYAMDGEIQDEVRRHRDGWLAEGLVEAGELAEPVALMGNTNVFWAGGIVASALAGRDELRTIFEELLFSHWIAGGLRKAVGHNIGRRRPDVTPDDPYVFVSGEGSSFPSGHASTATQVAAVLSHHIDWWPADVLLYGMAGAVTYQRVAADKHWASDAFLGAAWGWGVARVVQRRRHADRSDFEPFFDPSSGSAGIRLRF